MPSSPRQELGERAGKKGCSLVAGNAKGEVWVFTLAAAKEEADCNKNDQETTEKNARPFMDKMYAAMTALTKQAPQAPPATLAKHAAIVIDGPSKARARTHTHARALTRTLAMHTHNTSLAHTTLH